MDWFRLDVGWIRHRKTHAAGPFGALAFIGIMDWCAEQESDGVIPRTIAELIAGQWRGGRGGRQVVDTLIKVGFLERAKDGDLQVHDYTVKQPTREELEAKRKADEDRRETERVRKRSWRESRKLSRGTSGDGPASVPLLDTRQVRDGTGQERQDPGPELDGQVGLEGVQGEPDRFAAGQDQDFDAAVVGAFTPILGDRLAYCWAKIRRSGGAAWANVIPEVFADLAAEHGSDAVSSAIEALSLADPNDLRGVERPRAYVVKTVADHAGKQAANESETVARTSAETK